MLDPRLSERTLWFTSERNTLPGGRRGRSYSVCDAAGSVLLSAHAPTWGREIVIRAADEAGPVLLLRRRRLFAVTGTVDVLAPAGQRLGTVHRSGWYADASGRRLGRFRDARSVGARGREALLAGTVEALLGGDGSDSQLSGPARFVWLIAGQPAGSLVNARLPFSRRPAQPPAGWRGMARRLLPQRALTALQDTFAARGWQLERPEPLDHDPLLALGAALMTVELAQW